MNKTKLTIGIFGFGVVGQGLYDIFKQREQGFEASIKKICIKDKFKKRSLDASYFTYDKHELLNDPDVNLIIELINDADEAYLIVKQALLNGKNVVTANKKMLAFHLKELIEIQKQTGASLLYEAAVCGSIPIIRTLEEYYNNELLFSVSGIFNGTSNFILSKIYNENLDYATALKQAQNLGFAESDPTNDVAGYDALFKLIVLVAHAYGVIIEPNNVLNFGIETLDSSDLIYAKQRGYKLKLVPIVKQLESGLVTLFVIPHFVKSDNFLFNVENEFNGVRVDAAFADSQFFYGKGAGGHPTGAAVLSDISANAYDYSYEYKKYYSSKKNIYETDVIFNLYVRYNDEQLINDLGFLVIDEKFETKNAKYVIGSISLKRLLLKKENLLKDKAFIALVNTDIKTNNGYKFQEKLEIEEVFTV